MNQEVKMLKEKGKIKGGQSIISRLLKVASFAFNFQTKLNKPGINDQSTRKFFIHTINPDDVIDPSKQQRMMAFWHNILASL